MGDGHHFPQNFPHLFSEKSPKFVAHWIGCAAKNSRTPPYLMVKHGKTNSFRLRFFQFIGWTSHFCSKSVTFFAFFDGWPEGKWLVSGAMFATYKCDNPRTRGHQDLVHLVHRVVNTTKINPSWDDLICSWISIIKSITIIEKDHISDIQSWTPSWNPIIYPSFTHH